MASDTRATKQEIPLLGLLRPEEDAATVLEVLQRLATRLEQIDDKLDRLADSISRPELDRDFYTIAEFAELVGKRQYTVREWCRLQRITAGKCESGRGGAKSWKISRQELERYRNHGLLPATYLH